MRVYRASNDKSRLNLSLCRDDPRRHAVRVGACSALDAHIAVANVIQRLVGQLHSDIRLREHGILAQNTSWQHATLEKQDFGHHGALLLQGT